MHLAYFACPASSTDLDLWSTGQSNLLLSLPASYNRLFFGIRRTCHSICLDSFRTQII